MWTQWRLLPTCNRMRILFVGGGTGGHFYPLLAIAESLQSREAAELFYMGPEPYNQEALNLHGIKFIYCPAGKNRMYRSILNFFDGFKIFFGIFCAFFKLLILYPDVIMSKGGYTSVPVVIAGWLLRIPIVVHESDAVPGRANLIAAKFARTVTIAHREVAEHFPAAKVVETGMPISRAITTPVSDPYAILGIPKDRPIILVTGGSSGAERLNDFVIKSLSQLLQSYTVIHQVGDANVERVTTTASSLFTDRAPLSRYYVFGHMTQERFGAALQVANLVITRAGSTTLFEIAVNGKPAIVIPIPEDISRDQRSNAYAYARATGAVVLEEHNLSDDLLVKEINNILGDQDTYNELSAGAKALTVGKGADTLADILINIGREHQ